MGKVSWDAAVKQLKEWEIEPESLLKLGSRIAKKGKRPETSKEVLRSSWIYDCAWHVYHRVGTKDQKKKITKTPLLIMTQKFFSPFDSLCYYLHFAAWK